MCVCICILSGQEDQIIFQNVIVDLCFPFQICIILQSGCIEPNRKCKIIEKMKTSSEREKVKKVHQKERKGKVHQRERK